MLPICLRYGSDIYNRIHIGTISEAYRKHIGITAKDRRRKGGGGSGRVWGFWGLSLALRGAFGGLWRNLFLVCKVFVFNGLQSQ